jgi:hypothetical protein
VVTSDKVSVNEGDSVTFTLTTENVKEGSTFSYEILGVSSADLSGASLTGNFVVEADGTDSITFNVAEDSLTEGEETAALRFWAGALPDVTVTVNDTSLTPTYSLSRSATAINEGQSVTFTLSTTGLADGTTVPYTLSGISSSDIGGVSLNGNFAVNNVGVATVTFTATADSTTEGSGETLTITSGGQSTTCFINDTSKQIQYNAITVSDTTPNEGDTLEFQFWVYNSTQTMYWSIDGNPTADFTSVSGSSTYSQTSSDANNTYYKHFLSIPITADTTTEGNELKYLRIRTSSTSGTIVLTQPFTIQDTSITVPYASSTLTDTGYASYGNYSVGAYVQGLPSYFWDISDPDSNDRGIRYTVGGGAIVGPYTYYSLATAGTNYLSVVEHYNHSGATNGWHAIGWAYGHRSAVNQSGLTGSYTDYSAPTNVNINKMFTGSYHKNFFHYVAQDNGIYRFYKYDVINRTTTLLYSFNYAASTPNGVHYQALCSIYDYCRDIWIVHARGDSGAGNAATYLEMWDSTGYLGRKYVGVNIMGGIFVNANTNETPSINDYIILKKKSGNIQTLRAS